MSSVCHSPERGESASVPAANGGGSVRLPFVWRFGEVSSSLDVAFLLSGRGWLDVWDSVQAVSQTSGRGQLRRHWVSPPGNIYAALRLPSLPPFDGTAAAPAMGLLLACALRTETGVAAYVEPALVAEGEPEAAVPGNYNLISCTGELLGRQSYFGQGAGRYPTAANVVQDCLDLLAGEDGFYTETARPMAVEADAVAHPYYVRTRTADPWLESVTADRWDSGVITGAVPVGQMLRWAAAQRQRDPGCFVAGIR